MQSGPKAASKKRSLTDGRVSPSKENWHDVLCEWGGFEGRDRLQKVISNFETQGLHHISLQIENFPDEADSSRRKRKKARIRDDVALSTKVNWTSCGRC